MDETILKRPSMIAISPPVLVPPIRSKYSHGRGVCSRPVWRLISSIISCNIKTDDNHLTPLRPEIVLEVDGRLSLSLVLDLSAVLPLFHTGTQYPRWALL